MKKIKLFILLLLLCIPFFTEADMIPISLDSYSNEVSIGSTVTYVVTGVAFEEGKGTNLDGKFIYDTNYLEYVDITCDDPNFIEGETIRPEIKIVEKNNGLLEYNVINEFGLEGIYEVKITFKVKAVPREGQLEVKFYPKDSSVLYDSDYANIGINVLGNPVIEDDVNNEEIVEEENIVENEKTEDSKKTESTDKCKELENTNKLVVIILIISILGNIITIVCLVIQSRKFKMKNIKN
ncbi:MAG: hypothetical protein IJN90_03430 [Bacilli bacterium]|nr:hypothetical protein [Bacilli bacterium]